MDEQERDPREQAAWEHRMRNEDEILRVLESDDEAEQRKVAALHGWDDERFRLFRHYARLRRAVIDRGREELTRRKASGPEPDADERRLRFLYEQVESTVRDAVRLLISKGYDTVGSGFAGVAGTQHVVVGNVDLSPEMIPDSLRTSLAESGIAVTVETDRILFETDRLLSENEIHDTWMGIARSLPERPPVNPWKIPDYREEHEELERTARELGIDLYELIGAYSTATLEPLRHEDWDRMQNCDSRDGSWTLEDVLSYYPARPDHPRDAKRILDGLNAGVSMPAPIVLFREGHPPYLVAGSTRLSVARATGRTPKVFAVRM